MKTLLPLLAIAILTAATAQAAGRWHGAGWYQVVEHRRSDMPAWKFIYHDAPFASEAECLKTLHGDYTDPGVDEEDSDTFNDFSCEKLETQPDWDHD